MTTHPDIAAIREALEQNASIMGIREHEVFAALDRLEGRMTWQPENPKGTFKCPICGKSEPHNHAEIRQMAIGLTCQLQNISSMHSVVAILEHAIENILKTYCPTVPLPTPPESEAGK